MPTESAPVPATDEVTCVTCGRRVPLARADVVGLGYRCADCTLRAEVGELTGSMVIGAIGVAFGAGGIGFERWRRFRVR